MHSEFLLSTLFLNWPRRLNLFLKARFLENLRKKLWNLDNTSRSNPVNSCSYYGQLPQNFWSRRYSIALKRRKSHSQRHSVIRGSVFSEQTVVEVVFLPDMQQMQYWPRTTGNTGLDWIPALELTAAPFGQVFAGIALVLGQYTYSKIIVDIGFDGVNRDYPSTIFEASWFCFRGILDFTIDHWAPPGRIGEMILCSSIAHVRVPEILHLSACRASLHHTAYCSWLVTSFSFFHFFSSHHIF